MLRFSPMTRRPESSAPGRKKSDPARTLILPPADRAFWQPSGSDSRPLLYLAWGERQFGTMPIARHRHHGWVYLLVDEGTPTLVLEDAAEVLAPGALVVLGPDCAFGWADEPGSVSKLLVWMWRRPVHVPLASLAPHTFSRSHASEAGRAELRRWHALTREEVNRHDAHSATALTGLQFLVETTFVRASEHDPRDDTIARALAWIETHFATRQPLARLSDYLGVSTATVHRLFRERLGTTVRRKIAAVRQQTARQLLASGDMTIKEIAFRLGYRHAHDFSRAYRNHAGELPMRRSDLARRTVAAKSKRLLDERRR